MARDLGHELDDSTLNRQVNLDIFFLMIYIYIYLYLNVIVFFIKIKNNNHHVLLKF
jgi:hypothetical protein